MKQFLLKLLGVDAETIRKQPRKEVGIEIQTQCVVFDTGTGYVPANQVMGEALREVAKQLLTGKTLELVDVWEVGQVGSKERRRQNFEKRDAERKESSASKAKARES